MSTESVFVYGRGDKLRQILEAFVGAADSIRFLILPDWKGESPCPGIPAVSLEAVSSERLREGRIVILGQRDERQIRRELQQRFSLDDGCFLSQREWIAQLLADDRILFRPVHARVDICTCCQLDCLKCPMRRDPRCSIGSGSVSVAQFERFLDDNPFIQHIEISNNGEPFLHPHLHELLTAAHARHVALSCYNGTNFNYVTEPVLEGLVAFQFGLINVALDGASQETYQIYRRNGDFSRVLENVRKLNAIKRRCRSELPRLSWQFVMMGHNYHEMEQAKEMARELDMTIQFRESWSRADREAVAALRQKQAPAPSAPASRITDEDYNTFSAYCSDLFFSPQINWDGRLLGCCQIYRSDWGMNVFEEGYLACLNSEPYRGTLRRILLSDCAEGSMPCATCRRFPKSAAEKDAVLCV